MRIVIVWGLFVLEYQFCTTKTVTILVLFAFGVQVQYNENCYSFGLVWKYDVCFYDWAPHLIVLKALSGFVTV